MNKIKLLKFVDNILGKPLVFLLCRVKKHHKGYPAKFKKILIIRPGGIGDAVLLLPAINSLRAKFPDADIDLLCEKRNADIFRLSKGISRIYLYDKGGGLFKYLRNRYDVVIDTEQWHRLPAVVAYLTGAAVRIGFDTNERGRLFTHGIAYSHDDYEVYSFLHLIEPLVSRCGLRVADCGLSFNPEAPFLDIREAPTGNGYRPLVINHFKKNTKGLIVIFPGASVAERRWGGDRYGRVAKVLSDKGYEIVILGSDADRRDADRIKEYAGDCIDLTGRTNLRDLAAVLNMSKLLLTADSGLMHIAYAVGTPTVSLFGSGIEKKWAPRGRKHTVLNKHLDCSPCTRFGYTPSCRKKVKCMSLISVEEVLQAAKSTIEKSG